MRCWQLGTSAGGIASRIGAQVVVVGEPIHDVLAMPVQRKHSPAPDMLNCSKAKSADEMPIKTPIRTGQFGGWQTGIF